MKAKHHPVKQNPAFLYHIGVGIVISFVMCLALVVSIVANPTPYSSGFVELERIINSVRASIILCFFIPLISSVMTSILIQGHNKQALRSVAICTAICVYFVMNIVMIFIGTTFSIYTFTVSLIPTTLLILFALDYIRRRSQQTEKAKRV